LEIAVTYTSPETVLSPKASVSNLRVLLNTGEGGYSLASMRWDGDERLGVRWNGSPDNLLGNPQSRGIATWFVLPEEIAAPLRARYEDSAGQLTQQNADITRVRLRPLPDRISKGEIQEKLDDQWVLSITDRAAGNMEIMNPRTGHFLALDRSHVESLQRDPVRHQPHSPKHGLLSLTVQLVFEDGNVRLEPLRTLNDRIASLYSNLTQDGYRGNHAAVTALIQEARASLADPSGNLGPWESLELDYAGAAVRTNFLRLALVAIDKAIAVNRLSAPEYEYGFTYGQRSAIRSSP
jgi:hypothetical protein